MVFIFLILGGFCFTLASLSLHSKLNLNPKSNNGAPCSLATALAAAAPCGTFSLPSPFLTLFFHCCWPPRCLICLLLSTQLTSHCVQLNSNFSTFLSPPTLLSFSSLLPGSLLSFSLHSVFLLCPSLLRLLSCFRCAVHESVCCSDPLPPLSFTTLFLTLSPLFSASLKLTSLDFRLLFRSLLLCFSISSFHHWLVSLQSTLSRSFSSSLLLFPSPSHSLPPSDKQCRFILGALNSFAKRLSIIIFVNNSLAQCVAMA